jgi:phosphoribosylglycinamide formyltransferase-1
MGSSPGKKIAVLFSGEGTNFAYLATHLPSRNIVIAVALTNWPDAGGIAVAQQHGIPLEVVDHRDFASREAFDAEVLARLEEYDVDLVVLAGFMRILTPVFTEAVRAINLHPSLLPRHKGLRAIERSWEDRNSEGGVSVHWVSSELDGGAMILQKSISKAGLDFSAYHDQIRRMEKEGLLEAIETVLRPDVL